MTMMANSSLEYTCINIGEIGEGAIEADKTKEAMIAFKCFDYFYRERWGREISCY